MKKIIFMVASAALLTSCSFTADYVSPDWFAFSPDEQFEGSVIDMSDWLHKPAGKHGFVQLQDDDFVFEDGTPVKFWGVNICSARPYSDNATIEQWVRQLSHYGVNGVRFHKFTQHGMSETRSDRLSDEHWAQFDYFQASLRAAGIYYGWSPIYGHKLRPGDKERLLAYDEIMNADMGSHLSRSTIGLVNFAEDLQELHIDLIVGMLNHVNPITGLRYADDPALSFVELQNEDNIWFSTCDRMMQLCPSYKKLHQQQFCTWLRERYGDQEGLTNAWGEEAFQWGKEVRHEDWNLDLCNITPVCNQGIFGYEYNKYTEMDTVMPLFLRDNALFLYEEQVAFYKKFVRAIRETGYKGPIVGSCWQAGGGITHYYNISADREVGFIDRHNYFGGGTGHRLVPGKINNRSMVSAPGSGFLNTGRQQVSDRPYALSEWMSLMPNEWIVEGSPIVAIYGMGLNDWDASYSFASDYPYFTKTIHTPGVYNVNMPTQLPLYPALASMIYRNEVIEGEVVSTRHVHLPSLHDGIVGFDEQVRQDWDQKEFTGTPPNEAFAIGKVELQYTDEFVETPVPDLTSFWDTTAQVITSSTGQLKWDYSGNGYFTVATEFTEGVIGFSGGVPVKAGEMTFRIKTPFSAVLVTSAERDADLESSDRILVTTMARAKNTGMELNEEKTEIITPGEAPILLEPVQLQIHFKRKVRQIRPLDHCGKPTGEVIDVNSKNVVLDGAQHKALYYELLL